MIMEQNKSVAFLIDPIEDLDFTSDSTLVIANEFQIRDYKLFYFLPQSLIFENDQLYAKGRYFKIDYEGQNITELNSDKVLLEYCNIMPLYKIFYFISI